MSDCLAIEKSEFCSDTRASVEIYDLRELTHEEVEAVGGAYWTIVWRIALIAGPVIWEAFHNEQASSPEEAESIMAPIITQLQDVEDVTVQVNQGEGNVIFNLTVNFNFGGSGG